MGTSGARAADVPDPEPPAPPTLDAVAREAGVSRSTASRAINGGLKVSPRARAAVDAAVTRLGYAPNQAARSLVTRRTDAIALVVPESDTRIWTDPFFAQAVHGTNSALSSAGLQLVLLISREDDDADRMVRYLRSGHVDGAVVVSHHRADGLDRATSTPGFPMVFVGRPIDPHESTVYVDVDNASAAAAVTRRLLDLGRKRVATICGPQDMTAGIERLKGWRETLASAGLDDSLVEAGDFTTDSGSAAMTRLLARDRDIDAVFAASDLMAWGAMEVLAESGRRIPDDVAVVGFDDLDIARRTRPPLTTVRNPVQDLARAATGLVLDLIDGAAPPSGPVMFPGLVVQRESG